VNQTIFWDSVSADKEFSHPLDLSRFARLVPRDARILDYGCGYGRVCRELFAAGYRNTHGVDLSPRMIERARVENPELSFELLTDVDRCQHDPFDAVLLFSVLTCIPDDENQRELIDRLHRYLRPGGILYVSDLLVQEDQRNRQRYEQFREVYGTYGVFELEPGVVFRHLRRDWIDELFREFERMDFVEIDVLTMNRHPARGFQFFGRKQKFTKEDR
jgi:SAM-dependent methyltransferase